MTPWNKNIAGLPYFTSTDAFKYLDERMSGFYTDTPMLHAPLRQWAETAEARLLNHDSYAVRTYGQS
jgi:hypothetical protein|tara:strand:- start:1345 stop:1545 length:201 start_codon:yes stop_codon:yes gene_type:complete